MRPPPNRITYARYPRTAFGQTAPTVRGAGPFPPVGADKRELVLFGNSGQYASRSEADFAVCLAMFGAGYEEAEVWAVMTDPAHGFLGEVPREGRDGER